MIGSWQVQVHAARPFTIHGDLYYEMMVERLDAPSETGFTLLLPQHTIAAEPQPGQKLEVTFLMGQITGAKTIA